MEIISSADDSQEQTIHLQTLVQAISDYLEKGSEWSPEDKKAALAAIRSTLLLLGWITDEKQLNESDLESDRKHAQQALESRSK